MKIYTRKGDDGRTGIWGGRRLAKDHARLEAIGAVDECNAAVGLAAAHLATGSISATASDRNVPAQELLTSIQQDLLVIGSELMAPDHTGAGSTLPRIAPDDTIRLETAIDELESSLPELRNFILPGGTLAAAHLHLARTLCRRAERRVTTLHRHEPADPHLAAYLNRLSDLLFVLARHANQAHGSPDVIWAPRT